MDLDGILWQTVSSLIPMMLCLVGTCAQYGRLREALDHWRYRTLLFLWYIMYIYSIFQMEAAVRLSSGCQGHFETELKEEFNLTASCLPRRSPFATEWLETEFPCFLTSLLWIMTRWGYIMNLPDIHDELQFQTYPRFTLHGGTIYFHCKIATGANISNLWPQQIQAVSFNLFMIQSC